MGLLGNVNSGELNNSQIETFGYLIIHYDFRQINLSVGNGKTASCTSPSLLTFLKIVCYTWCFRGLNFRCKNSFSNAYVSTSYLRNQATESVGSVGVEYLLGSWHRIWSHSFLQDFREMVEWNGCCAVAVAGIWQRSRTTIACFFFPMTNSEIVVIDIYVESISWTGPIYMKNINRM